MTLKRRVNVACFDLKSVSGFFHGIALVMEVQNQTHLEWKTYDESTVLNIAYAMLPWKGKPGTVQVTQDWGKINQAAERRAEHMLLAFLSKLFCEGPAAAQRYAAEMKALQQDAAQFTAQRLADANAINREVAGESAQAVVALSRIQLASTLTLATMSCLLGVGAIAVPLSTGIGAAAVALGYNVAGTFIGDQGQLTDAGAVAISVESTKTGIGIGIDAGKEKAGEMLVHHAKANTKLLQEAEKKVLEYQTVIARKTSSAKIAKLGRAMAPHEELAAAARTQLAQNVARTSALRAASIVAKAIPVIFFAHDVYNALQTYNANIKDAGTL